MKVTYFCMGPAVRPNEDFLSHGTKTKICCDPMKLSPFYKMHVIAKGICKPMISVIY